jgi:hypothetical protein
MVKGEGLRVWKRGRVRGGERVKSGEKRKGLMVEKNGKVLSLGLRQ